MFVVAGVRDEHLVVVESALQIPLLPKRETPKYSEQSRERTTGGAPHEERRRTLMR